MTVQHKIFLKCYVPGIYQKNYIFNALSHLLLIKEGAYEETEAYNG